MQLFAADVDFVLRSSCHVDAGSVVKVSEVYAASVFRVEVRWVLKCSCIYRFWFTCPKGEGLGASALSGPVGRVDKVKLSNGPC
jgi:hypothetical protein